MKHFPLYLARKYIFSGKNAIEVNVISWVAFLALGFVTTCLLLILSVFSGLEDLNLKFYSDLSPDLEITAARGKQLPNTLDVEKILNQNPQVQSYSKTIEEKAYVSYQGKSHIITLKGVDAQITQIFPLDTMVKFGNYLDFNYNDEILISGEVSSRLSLFVDTQTPASLFVPKPGTGIIENQEEAFNQIQVYNTGIFFINDNYAQHVIGTLPMVQKLLNFSPQTYYALELKLSPDADVEEVKQQLQSQLGAAYVLKNRQELNAAFLKMMNTENLVIYLILVLVLIIASFNLAGSIAILILDKRKAAQTLWSMGFTNANIKKVFFYTGMYISTYALAMGLLLGTLIAWVQMKWGILMISQFVAFPVKFTWQNYALTIASVMVIGAVVSFLVSRKAGVKSV